MAELFDDRETIRELQKGAGLSPSSIQKFKREIAGDVLTDRLNLVAYSQTAAMYEIKPAIVVVPASEDDCRASVEFARRNGLAVTGRGGGSSLAGQALSKEGMILDFSKYMGDVLEFDIDKNEIDVGPGIRLDVLTKFLAGHGKFFPPDPASGRAATLGGMASTNAGGTRTVKYGATREWVRRLHLVLSDTSTAIAEPFDIGGKLHAAIENTGGMWPKILNRLDKLLTQYADLIETHRPGTFKNSSGYLLYDVLNGYTFDPVKLLVGSESTLSLFTRLRLKVLDVPPYRRLSLSFYPDLHRMCEAVNAALKYEPVMLEVMDEGYINLAKERSGVIRRLVPETPTYVLMIEIEGDTGIGVSRRIHHLEEELTEGESPLASGFVIADTDEQRDELLEIRRASNNILNRSRGSRKPSDVIEDTSVNPKDLEGFLTQLYDLLAKLEMDFFVYGHAGSGNLHIRPVLDLKKEVDLGKMVRLAAGVADIVKSFGGTLGGEHGDGRLRTPLLEKFFPELHPLFVEVKSIFDPANIFNPGIIIAEKDMTPASIRENMKFGEDYTFADTRSPLDSDYARDEIEACHGCGYCLEFCPSYAASHNELDTPRARSAVLRHLISGKLPPDAQGEADFGRMIASCLGCGRCERLCFAETGYGKVNMHAHIARGQKHPASVGEKLLTNIPWLARVRATAPKLFDRFIRAPWVRRAVEKVTGASAERPLPSFDKAPLSKFYPQRDLYGTYDNPLVYFHGCNAGFVNVSGEGLPGIRLLEELGFDLLVPEQGCCGLPKISTNDVDGAKEDAAAFVKTFLPFAERGIRIVTTCPSCAHYLRDHLKHFVDKETVEKITPMVYDINEILADELSRDDAPKLKLSEPMRAALHVPCHTAAMGGEEKLAEVLRKIEGLRLVELSDNCCGMGGSWGIKKDNDDKSVRLGEDRAREIKSKNVDAVITPCGMCSLQIGDLTRLRMIHPVQLLDEALRYGKESKKEEETQEDDMDENEDVEPEE